VFTRTASGRSSPRARPSIRWWVEAFSGQCSETTSLRRSRSSRETDVSGPPVGSAGVVDQQLDIEAPQPGRHTPADVPVPDEADGRSGELPRRVDAGAVPTAGADIPVEQGDAPQQRQHQPDGVVGDRVLVGPGRRGYLHAPLGGGVEVDRIDADADPGDDPQVDRGAQHAGGERVSGDDGAHDTDQQVAQLVRAPGAQLRGQAELEPRRHERAAEGLVGDVVVGPGDEHDLTLVAAGDPITVRPGARSQRRSV
jgi:hypothetical protein